MNLTISNIAIRNTNNLFNINDLHKASGGEDKHAPRRWLQNQQTTDLIQELSKDGNPSLKENQQVIQVNHGGSNRGTFVCKELVYAYATWISPKFFLQVIRTFDAYISGSLKPVSQTTPTERTPLRDAVNLLVAKRGLNYSEAYNMVHQRFGVSHIDEIPAEQLPDAVAYVHALALHSGLVGDVLDKPVAPALPAPAPLDDDLLLSIGHLLLHAQEMRLFVNRYLPAFENLGLDNKGSLWSYVHDTEPCFAKVRAFFLQQKPYQNHYFFADRVDFLRREIMTTAKI